MNAKLAAARAAVDLVESGMCVGLGSGSTVDLAIDALARRVREGLEVRIVVASSRSEARAWKAGLRLETLDAFERLDLVIDGTDEFDPRLNLIKGGGAALVREKLLAAAADRFVVACDASKRVATLGAFPLPVAVVPFGGRHTAARLERFCASARIRRHEGEPVVTDDGLWIADLHCGAIADPAALERELNQVVGVVEVGLFVELAERVLVGHEDGRVEVVTPSPG